MIFNKLCTLPHDIKCNILNYLYFKETEKINYINQINNIICNYDSIIINELEKVFFKEDIYKSFIRWIIIYEPNINDYIEKNYTIQYEINNKTRQEDELRCIFKLLTIHHIQKFYIFIMKS
tara:strand:- start:33 stop:395 length:363 start_codon:yes stop_codon:yes gene_type:complete